jgi:pimeloyl-ACP methyl ester carboxylesterase
MLLNPLGSDRAGINVSCNYYSWAGTPREDYSFWAVPPACWFGADRIAKSESRPAASSNPVNASRIAKFESGPAASSNPVNASALIIVGWSNGGDTAYNLAKRMARVDALITLDPVSRLTSAHWLPFVGKFTKPPEVRFWFHAFTKSSGVNKLNTGNIFARAGGPWNDQPGADVNVMVRGNHGDTLAMLTKLTHSEKYHTFLRGFHWGER